MASPQLISRPRSPLGGCRTEDPDYLAKQLITYIGNKRALLAPIEAALQAVRARLGKERLDILDGFSGSGVVARLCKRHARTLVVNDAEEYARVIATCYLTNRDDYPGPRVAAAVAELNAEVDSAGLPEGFIERLYSPWDDHDVQPGERVFYTRANARRLDNYRRLIEQRPAEIRPWLLGPLLSAASVHANTAGVLKGFYKDRDTGLGRFGGRGADALTRILGKIELRAPVLSRFSCQTQVHMADTNELVSELGALDLAYFDPPYNQHPYGSNYFMLNLLAGYEQPAEISSVSGIPAGWRRSRYNVRARSLPSLAELLHDVDSRFVLLSYNDEGFIPIGELRALLDAIGPVQELETRHATFRGSRNLRDRSLKVTEHLFLVDKG